MSKKILISITKINEIRIALIDGYYLYKLDIEEAYNKQKRSNIYKGIIVHIEHSLNAFFVEYGGNKHGFLPFKEVSNFYLNKTSNEQVNIFDYLKKGTELIVQINKEERGNKGASLTTYISIAGCYLVLMPYNYKCIGISKKINNEDRIKLKSKLLNLNIPNNMGIIIRTAGANKNFEEFQWDLNILLNHWNEIKSSSFVKKAPYLIYQESNIIMRAIRDYLRTDIEEIIVDNPRIYKIICSYIKVMKSDFLNIIKLYNGNITLFNKYKIEKQIISAFKHTIKLMSGGVIIIDYTEALTSIDVNSFKFTHGNDVEETALQTNIEACDEICRQLMLRDLGGLIIIDFIDMNILKNKKIVENRLIDLFEKDRARIQIGKISKFGLLELSRQRLKKGISDFSEVMCSKCKGKGKVHTINTISLIVLNILHKLSLKSNITKIHIELSVDIMFYILNNKRHIIYNIEKKQFVNIVLFPNKLLAFSEYRFIKIRKNINNKLTFICNVNNDELFMKSSY